MEITGVEIPKKIGRNVVPIQAGETCHASRVGEAMRDKAINGLVRQRFFLKALLAAVAEMANQVVCGGRKEDVFSVCAPEK